MSATAYYNVISQLTTLLQTNPSINTVTDGDLDEVTVRKQTIFPMAHITIENVSLDKIPVFDISVIVADKPNNGNNEDTDNTNDILNNTLAVCSWLIENLRRGDIRDSGYHLLAGSASADPFDERFEDGLAGWALTFSLEVGQTISICDNFVTLTVTTDTTYSGTITLVDQAVGGDTYAVEVISGTGTFRAANRTSTYNATITDLNRQINTPQPMTITAPTATIDISEILG